ncbi:hypothetical protein [Bacillus spizizenii]|uniref:hypothetical protein n=1 Tax=Bacillus spizizenii TaxID=96241 RepID=UPI001F61C1E1|nr:hypothetical protein [Bacillus spizizenii]MCI4167356.1 hypothetical protein [Bacillus spizizenii]
MFQHIKKWRFYRETDNVLGAIYTIELAAVYHSRTIVCHIQRRFSHYDTRNRNPIGSIRWTSPY